MRPLPAKAKIRGLRDSRVIPTGANCASTHALMDALIHARARTHVRARMHALRSPHPLEQPHMYVHVHECMRSDGLGPDRCQTEDLRWRSSRCHHGRRRRLCPTRQRLVSAAARIGMRERVRARASTAPTPACGYRCADCTWLRTCTHGVRGGSGLPIDGSYCAFPACHRKPDGLAAQLVDEFYNMPPPPAEAGADRAADVCMLQHSTNARPTGACRRALRIQSSRPRWIVRLFVHAWCVCVRSVCLLLTRRRSCGVLNRARAEYLIGHGAARHGTAHHGRSGR